MKQSYTIERGAIEGVETFLRVAARQSFRQAADDLGVSTSAVSQTIRQLESRLGVALFARTTRSVGLTEAGSRYLAHARPAFEAMLAASAAAKGLANRPSGLLRLTVPRAAVPLILEPVLASFFEAYPDITIEIAANEDLIDLARDGFDAGIRMGQFIAEDMVTVRLSPPFPLSFVASPAYFARAGRPETIEALRSHACIRIRRSNGAIGDWTVLKDGRATDVVVTGPLIANDFPTILGAVVAGVGLAQMPRPIVGANLAAGKLEEVLAAVAPSSPGVFLYFSSRHQVLPKLRAFIDHVKASLQTGGGLARGGEK